MTYPAHTCSVLLLLASFICIHPAFSQTAPAKPKSDLITTLQDISKVYSVNHIMDDQNELINLSISSAGKSDLQQLLDKDIKTAESLRSPSITNDTVKTRVERYLAAAIKSYQALKQYGSSSKEFKAQYAAFHTQRNKYNDFLTTTYALNKFVKLTEDRYWAVMDKKNYIKSPRFGNYTTLQKSNIKGALLLLDSIGKATTNFQEKAIYQIEMADQYVKNSKTLGNRSEEAVDIYRSILDQQQYSLYLFEVWVKWRAVKQQNGGLSKSSDIPNDLYDKIREKTAMVILDYIKKNPADEMAINQFLVITTHDIIYRFGDYPYGNQNTVEYHSLFDNQ